MQGAKWLSEVALQIAWKRREVKSKGEEVSTECRVPENSKETKESLLKWTMQRKRKAIE